MKTYNTKGKRDILKAIRGGVEKLSYQVSSVAGSMI